MSGDNRTVGQYVFAAGDAETREWFELQWKIWPKRADDRLTTNISFHYGGVVAFRLEHEREPEMSRDFRSHVEWHDAHTIEQDAPQ